MSERVASLIRAANASVCVCVCVCVGVPVCVPVCVCVQCTVSGCDCKVGEGSLQGSHSTRQRGER